MRIEIRNDKAIIDGYVNAVARDSRPLRDKNGQRYIEQIVPGAFKRALSQNEVKLLLNHDEKRELGSTETNLTLREDAIGLRATAEIDDAEVIQKAREGKLRGWSFGFYERGASEEELASGMKRRYVEDMKLVEVSIIDDRKIPCYEATSIETRADGEEKVFTEPLETRAEVIEQKKEEKPDLERFKNRIKKLEKEN